MAINNLESPLFKAVYAAGASSGTPGEALANGKVYVYTSGGNYLNDQVTTWTDKAKTTPNAQPIVLDNSGEAEIWFDGTYDVAVYSSSDELQYTIIGVGSSLSVSSTGNYNQVLNGSFESLTSGSPDNWTLAPSTNGTIAIDATAGDQLHGINSLKFTSVDSGGAGTATSTSFDVSSSEAIYVQFSHKVEDADSSTNEVLINFYQYDDTASAVTPQATAFSASSIATGNSTTWTTISRRVTVPSDAVTAELVVNGIDGAGTDTTGSFYIDNILVTNEVTLEPSIYDSSGNELVLTDKEASAVNYIKVTNSATGNPIPISVEGEDDVGFNFNAKNSEEMLKLRATAGGVNEVTITNNSTTNAPSIAATGSDTNVGLDLASKGSGVITANSKRDLEKGVIQFSESSSGAYQLVTNTTPAVDNTVPTATEGDEIITASITPIYTDSYIKISFDVSAEVASSGSTGIITVVDKTGSSVLKVVASEGGTTNNSECFCGHIYVSAPAGANTYSLRAGVYPSGNFHINGKGGSQVFGGTMQTQLTLEEVR